MNSLPYSVLILLAAGDEGAKLNPILAFAPWIIIGVLFYMMMIRPERRKRADLNNMLDNLKKNDRVITVGGIYGTVVNTPQGGEEVTLKVDENTNTRLRVLRSSISRVIRVENDGGGPSA